MGDQAGVLPQVIGFVISGIFALYLWISNNSGRRKGEKGNPPTIGVRRDPVEDPVLCAEAGARWDHARQMQCNAKTDEAAANMRVEQLSKSEEDNNTKGVSLAIAAASAAVGGLVTGIFFIQIAAAAIGAGLLIIAAVFFGIAVDYGAQGKVAKADAANKVLARQFWDGQVVALRAHINSFCTIAEANAFLNRVSHC